VATIPFFPETSDSEIPKGKGSEGVTEVGRLVALLHYQIMIAEARTLNFDPEFSVHYVTQLSVEYNVASEFTTLLFLHSAEQFLDNNLSCPTWHP
jgi:hypothetical protein